ncbi:uncharacterized protein [Typha latifolia]|uniref:uncharacterized protein isoform X1 n=1 Tax=Typha latifolia TaxID=4733 RepID=UPI003C2BF3DB
MAAASFANYSVSFSPRPLCSSNSSSKPLKSLSLVLPIRRQSSGKSTHGVLSSQFRRRSFRAASKVAETDQKMINGDEENQTQESNPGVKIDPQNLPAMRNLIKAYKNAHLEGDEKTVYEMEAAICAVENLKNDLSASFADITTEISVGKDNFLRLKADFENFRKKSEKDRLTFTSDIQGDVVESLLPIVDSFEKAKQQVLPETDKERKIETSYQGIYKQFVETLRSLGVGVVETVGKPFDPAIHEAVAQEESQQFKAGIISEEAGRGFVFKDRVLRPAVVKVSTGSGQAKSNLDSEKPVEQSEVIPDSADNSESQSQ